MHGDIEHDHLGSSSFRRLRERLWRGRHRARRGRVSGAPGVIALGAAPGAVSAAPRHLLSGSDSLVELGVIDKSPSPDVGPVSPDPTDRIARDANVLGRALRLLRQRAGMTQDNLAARAGTDSAALSHIEKGDRDPRWSTVVRLLDALESDLQRLSEVMAEVERQAHPRRR